MLLPDNIHKMEPSDDFCESCEAPLLDIIYHKVESIQFLINIIENFLRDSGIKIFIFILKDKTPLENGETNISSCLFCDKHLKVCIENYLTAVRNRAERQATMGGHRRGGGGGGRGRGRGRGGGRGRPKRSSQDW